MFHERKTFHQVIQPSQGAGDLQLQQRSSYCLVMEKWVIASEVTAFIKKYCTCKFLPSMCRIIREQHQVMAHWGGQGWIIGNYYWLACNWLFGSQMRCREVGVELKNYFFIHWKKAVTWFFSSVWLQGYPCKQLMLFSCSRVMMKCSCLSAWPLLLVYLYQNPVALV